MYIEREGRRVAVTSAGQNPSNNDYTQSCLNLLVQHVAIQAPLIASKRFFAFHENRVCSTFTYTRLIPA